MLNKTSASGLASYKIGLTPPPVGAAPPPRWPAPASIRQGRTNRRNPTLTRHTSHLLPYRGMGSGIPRALTEWPQIDLIDDPVGNQFSAVVWRPKSPTGQVTEPIRRLRAVMVAEHSRSDLQHLLALRHRDSFMATYLQPALDAGWVEMTIPQKSTIRLQKCRLSQAGKALLENQDT